MSLKRIKRNFGFLIAGAVLFAVAVNVYYEFNTADLEESKCPCILTR
jgi:hypothetical protein